MSRFIAHIQQTSGAAVYIDCDAAYVNDGGVLSLCINTYIGAIACWQPEAWDSYQLESPPQPHEQPTQPSCGCQVHVRRGGECMWGVVEGIDGDLLQIDTYDQDPRFAKRLSRTHDESRQIDGSWHWPHDDPQPSEPETFAQRGDRLRAEEAAELAALVADWLAVRDRYAGSPAVQLAIDLHQPRRRYAVVQCDHCQTGDDTPDADYASWPCATFAALAATVEPLAEVQQEARPCVGSIVHVRHSTADACMVGDVEEVVGDTLVVSTGGREPRWGKHLTSTHDESRQADGSWHWPERA